MFAWRGPARRGGGTTGACQTSALLFLHKPDLWFFINLGGVLQGEAQEKQDYSSSVLSDRHAAHVYSLSNNSAAAAAASTCSLHGFRYCSVFQPDLSSRRWADWILKWYCLAFNRNTLACEHRDKTFKWFFKIYSKRRTPKFISNTPSNYTEM